MNKLGVVVSGVAVVWIAISGYFYEICNMFGSSCIGYVTPSGFVVAIGLVILAIGLL